MKNEIYLKMPDGFKHYNVHAAAFEYCCDICGGLISSRRSSGVKFCSAKCRKRASIGHTNFNTGCTCKHCGGFFSTPQPFQHPEYCSNACRQAAYRKRKARQTT